MLFLACFSFSESMPCHFAQGVKAAFPDHHVAKSTMHGCTTYSFPDLLSPPFVNSHLASAKGSKYSLL